MSQNNSRIDYLELAVRDVAVAKAFYTSAFGWTFTDYGPDYTSFHDGRLAGGFRLESNANAPTTSPVLVVIFASDLAAAEKSVLAAGGSISTAPFEFPGGRRFHFRDPNGIELAVWSDQRADGSKID